jgi:2-iminobutanoate/2-iminopropanoate deaminase
LRPEAGLRHPQAPRGPPARQGAKLPVRIEGLRVSIAVIAQA